MSWFGSRDVACRDAVELMTDYLEGALRPAEVRRLERHLAACPHCAEYLEQMRITIALSGRVRADDLDGSARQALSEVYARWRSPDQPA
jgi:anti-sigma factor RsiW